MAISNVCDDLPEFVTPAELARLLRVSAMTIYRMCEDQELDAIRFGRTVRITRASIRDYLDRQTL